MKKILFAASVLLVTLSSCTTIKKTATTIDVSNRIESVSDVDLEISSKRISYTYYSTPRVRRGGKQNVYNAAVAEALQNNDNADVLVAPEYEAVIRQKLFGGKKIKRVLVKGYPAKYKEFRIQK